MRVCIYAEVAREIGRLTKGRVRTCYARNRLNGRRTFPISSVISYLQRGTDKRKTNGKRAGRNALIERSRDNIDQVYKAIITPDPAKPNDPNAFHVNRDLIWSMATDIPFAGKGVPFTEGRTLRTLLENGLQGKLRLETGAQANEAEVKNIIDRFMPSILDSDKQVRTKLLELRKFFDSALEKSDPQLYEKLTKRAAGATPQPPAGEEGAVFQGSDVRGNIFKRPNGTMFLVPKH